KINLYNQRHRVKFREQSIAEMLEIEQKSLHQLPSKPFEVYKPITTVCHGNFHLSWYTNIQMSATMLRTI
ncbi:MAG: hypothetical protein LBT47_06115, partial [Deltaproteobacteria bacterium]|nr:hypothetical protein [Deltaproteobacteria bacterium]